MDATILDNRLIIKNELSFFKDLIEKVNGSVHILRIDESGNTLPVWMNSHYSKILGFDLEERQKLGFDYEPDKLYHPEDIDIIRTGIIRLLKNRDNGSAGMFRVKSKEGNWKWVLSSCKPITIEDNPNCLLCLMVDVTECMADFIELTEKYTQEIRLLKNEILLRELTTTEKEIIKSLVKGLTTSEIAEKRNRSYDTVNNHKRNIYRKLKITRISELICFAKDTGLD